MGNLKFIKASYPTPYGVLELSIENKNGRPKISFSAPDGVEIII